MIFIRFLTGTEDSDLRLGSALPARRNILKGPWEKFTKVYTALGNEDTVSAQKIKIEIIKNRQIKKCCNTEVCIYFIFFIKGYFADITSYMLMNDASLGELNKRLDRTVSSLQFRPNIVVSGCEPFAEDSWEWIKIGENVVLRNVKPCPRSVTRLEHVR